MLKVGDKDKLASGAAKMFDCHFAECVDSRKIENVTSVKYRRSI